MKKLKPVLQNILFKRYVNSLLNEQSIAPPPIRLPSAGYAPWKLPTPNAIRPTFELPVTPTEVSPGTTTIFANPNVPPGSGAEQTKKKLSFDDAQTVIKNEIESGLSKTKNQKELVDYVFDKQTELLSDSEYGDQLSIYAGNEIKNRLGLAKTETLPTPIEPKPFKFPTQNPKEVIKPSPLTTTPSTAPVEEPEFNYSPKEKSVTPTLSALFPSMVPIRYSKLRASPDEELELQTKSEFKGPEKFKTAVGSDELEIRRKDGMGTFPGMEPSEQDEIEPYEGSMYDVDADLLLKNILGKYSGTYRIE